MRHLLLRAMPVLLIAPVAVMSFALPTLAGASPSSDRLDRLHQVRPDAAISIQSVQVLDEIDVVPTDPTLATGPAPEPTPVPPPVVIASQTGRCGQDLSCFLACTRAHESDTSGGYSAVSSDGAFHGAYQFLQSTWDGAVAGAGFAEYIGVPAEQAPPAVQDAAAAFLYSVSGNAPGGGRC